MFDFDELDDQAPIQAPPRQTFAEAIKTVKTAADVDQAIETELLNGIDTSGVDAQKICLEEAKRNLPDFIRKVIPCITNGYNFTPEMLIERLFYISTSTTLSEVRFKEPKVHDETSPLVVLLLGWGGSGVHELETIAEFYTAQGATVIFTTQMGGVPSLMALQEAAIVEKLKASLLAKEGNCGRLLVHMMSNNGWSAWTRFMSAWLDGDTKLAPRFATLKDCVPLKSVLKGYVFDCCPDTRCDAAFFKQVIQGCFGGLARQCQVPELWRMVQSGDCDDEMQQAANEVGVSAEMTWATFEEHDCQVPRLFLYSSKDMLVRKEFVEKHISSLRHRKEVPEIHTVQFNKSGHAQIYITEKDQYQKEIKQFLGKPAFL
eukprot:gnl/MRDRNA2_/MRDRNA2_151096_c0_seq1.p1 gnl/MRDRNA2_/MRDRNA2_151096_c0~~gnl/MRDRNA2_/MRDRNA2_151096_c0_seq1.p1  ORF type:complete len:374 (+),score=92.50 gnl/MRDRNA2_/MRDRNA2_151096_c0_seq1:50-1171(+)